MSDGDNHAAQETAVPWAAWLLPKQSATLELKKYGLMIALRTNDGAIHSRLCLLRSRVRAHLNGSITRHRARSARSTCDDDVHRRVDPKRQKPDEHVGEAQLAIDPRDATWACGGGLRVTRRHESIDPRTRPMTLDRLRRRGQPRLNGRMIAPGSHD